MLARRFITIGLLLGFCFAWQAHALEKIIRVPIQTDYSVESEQFIASIGQLLRSPMTDGNLITELVNGDKIFPSMLESIRGARQSICFENYIWESGKLSDQFIEALSERARAGVKVHCLVDGHGALQFTHEDRRRLKASGAELQIYNPFNFAKPWRWNQRTHRKTLVVDGRIGFMGGACIADDWMGNAEAPPLWRDTHYRAEGPVVAEMQGVFMDNWLRSKSEVLHGEKYFPVLKPVGSSKAQAFKSGPEDGAEDARLLYLYSIAAARKSIRLCHAYFIPDSLAMEMILAARKRGVKVEIIAPVVIDMNMVRRAARSRWHKLLDAGVEFYEYKQAKLHTKILIVDDVWVSNGSVNFDDRSFRINDEGNINIWDHEFARKQIAQFEEDKSKSEHIDPVAFHNRPFCTRSWEWFCGLFRGLL